MFRFEATRTASNTLVLGSLVALLASACEGHHDDLGETSTTTTTTAGTGGAGGAPGSGGGGAPPVVEPDGPPKWTFVDGVVDADGVSFCFLKSPADAADAAAPWPSGGLLFGETATIDLPGAPVPSAGDLELVLVAGDPAATAGHTCREMADDPSVVPTLDVLSLGVLPGETATKKRSFVFVPTGCVGGVDHVDVNDQAICGMGYAPDLPTVGLVVAPLSRLSETATVALQVVLAASVSGPVDVYVTPSFDGATPALLVNKLALGQAAPFPPFADLSVSDLGGSAGPHLTTFNQGTGIAADDSIFGDALARGGLDGADVANGENVAFVAVGGPPGLVGETWWHGFAWVAVKP
jgi:hypothetical protein